MIEEEIYLHYGDKVALRSFVNNMYVAVNINEEYAAANGFHPILYVSPSFWGLSLSYSFWNF